MFLFFSEFIKSLLKSMTVTDIPFLTKIFVICLPTRPYPAIINQAFALGVNAYLIKAELLPSQIIEEVKRLIT